jgi:hypothetical protein
VRRPARIIVGRQIAGEQCMFIDKTLTKPQR